MASVKKPSSRSPSKSPHTSGWPLAARPSPKVCHLTSYIPYSHALNSRNTGAIADIRRAIPTAHIAYLPMDLTSFASIKSAAEIITSDPAARLHILVTNAGVMASPPGLTADGYEVQFGINHLGHALLTHLLLPVMRKTAKEDPSANVRVIALSGGYEGEFINPRGIHLEDMKTPDCGGLAPFNRYSQSKLANVTYARALAEREMDAGSGVKSVVVNPGFVKSGIGTSRPSPNVITKTPL